MRRTLTHPPRAIGMFALTPAILLPLLFGHPAEASMLRVTPFVGWTSPENRTSYGVQVGLFSGLLFSFEGEIFRVSPKEAYRVSTFYSGGVRVQPPLPGPVSPYVAAGLGVLREKQDDVSDSFFTSNFGGGAEVSPAEHISIQGEFRVFKASSHSDPSTFKRFSVGLGLKF